MRRSAEAGDAESQYFMALSNRGGVTGMAKNLEQGAKWYQMAAKQGHITSQAMLGLLYSTGDGVTKSFKEAAKWYKLAADQGEHFTIFLRSLAVVVFLGVLLLSLLGLLGCLFGNYSRRARNHAPYLRQKHR